MSFKSLFISSLVLATSTFADVSLPAINNNVSKRNTSDSIALSAITSPTELFTLVEMIVPGEAAEGGWLTFHTTRADTWNYVGHNGKSVTGHADGHLAPYSLPYISQSKSSPEQHWEP